MPRQNKSNQPSVSLFFWDKAKRQKKYIFGIALALPINTLLDSILPPIILASVLDRLARGDFIKDQIWQSFGPQLIFYAALVIIGGLSWRIIDAMQWRLESRVQKAIASQVFSHLLNQSAHFHANNFGGTLVSHNNKLMGGYIRFADTTVFGVAPLLLGSLFSVIVLSFVAPLFAAILAVFIVLYMTSAIYATRSGRLQGGRHAETESRQTGILADAITNVLTIKSFAGQRAEEARFDKATTATKKSLLRLGKTMQRQQYYFGSLLSGIDALALLLAVVSVMLFNANIGVVFLIFNYTSLAVQRLLSFSNNALRSYNRAIGDGASMAKILATPPEVVDPLDPEPSRISSGAINFKNVTFQHSDGKEPVFNNFNLRIKPGEKVGLVGHSGSGKTTFTRLLMRFSDINKGTISIDGQNIAAITQDDLRRAIAYVPQEPMLFHRSIIENISYGERSADQQTIKAVAKLAHADEFIDQLPQQYQTMVGERGVKLSGGQRQRIAIARAMLKNAPILLLDEATSALDSESEALIQSALWRLMENRTAIVIAHRLSTIQQMDRIIVLDKGQIVEQGSHNELINLPDGVYAKLWSRQSGGFLAAN